MESLFSLPLPFQRRLTKMYTDTKSSYDFVKEPVQSAEDPELLSLHRKLRIQKDRLVSWGLEWSDPTQSPDIDESINKAGLSELVGSVMSTIKEILAEAEPLWHSSRRASDEKKSMGASSEKSSLDRKPSLIIWDKSRFQDLLRDLTMSIDTLDDLSRTRQSARKGSAVKMSEASGSLLSKAPTVEEKLFESTRMQAPQQIDPASLIWPKDLKTIPSSTLPSSQASRQIVFIRRPTAVPDARRFGSQTLPTVPVLLEHAAYDPIYSITGITPSMTRFEKLFGALSQAYSSSEKIICGLLPLIGYFEEAEQSRFCLLFALPTHFGPIDIVSPKMPSITMLSDLLYNHNYEPSLEIKYRLAYNVANAVFDLHSKGVVHGNVVASNILFIEHQSPNKLELERVNMRQPHLASYDLFSDNATDSSDTPADPYTKMRRHPLDPRISRYTRLTSESKSLDLYSLAILLLEIGLWTGLTEVFPSISALPENPSAVFKSLASRCGSLYVKAVQACWQAPADELSQKARPDVMHQKIFWKVSKALDTCCAIDESDEESDEESESSSLVSLTPLRTTRTSTPMRSDTRDVKSPAMASFVMSPPPLRSEKSSFVTPTPTFSEKPALINTPPITTDAKVAKPRLKTYPAIRISQEHLDFWHTGLMPHINHVLRNFYKKHPESVEISLESIGETSATTKPTILVICTSVTKVRSLLKKSLVYDKEVYGLKVCRGKVVRSRKQSAKRSMANELGEFKPANAEHEDRPTNGASIGAYVGERHLPPVSFGGMILVDDKPYGLTVHHMLDDPSEGEEEEEEEEKDVTEPILRSSAHYYDMPDLTHSESSVYSSGDEEYMYSLSDYDSDFGSEADSDMSDDDSEVGEDSDDGMEAGDVKGIPQGCGEEYLITQPAIDDVSEDFYPNEETRDEDHIDSFQLGEVYASSGIRRRTENGTVHEIDWALFEFAEERCPEGNHIRDGSRFCNAEPAGGQYPLAVASTKELSDLKVHCMARTSGLQSGRILPGMVIVKIYGRQTPSSSYQVAGKLGVPGDSGAWVVDNEQGRACGHVLAWSSRKRVAYICPMDIILRDISETLNARSISLPGGEDLLLSTVSAKSPLSAVISPLSNSTSTLRSHSQSQHLSEGTSSIKPAILNTDEELSNMLRDLRLPPTPSAIDGIDPLSESYTSTSSSTLLSRDFQHRILYHQQGLRPADNDNEGDISGIIDTGLDMGEKKKMTNREDSGDILAYVSSLNLPMTKASNAWRVGTSPQPSVRTVEVLKAHSNEMNDDSGVETETYGPENGNVRMRDERRTTRHEFGNARGVTGIGAGVEIS